VVPMFLAMSFATAQRQQETRLPGVDEALGPDKLDPALNGWVEDMEATKLWWVGALLSLLGSLVSIMGMNLQRYSHRLEAAKPLAMRSPSYKKAPWVMGLLLVLVDIILDVVSFAFADLSLISAVGAMSLLFNAMIAPRFLREKMSKRDSIGTVCVFGGTVTAVIFANRKTPAYTFDDLVKNMLDPSFFIYTALWTVVITMGTLSIRHIKKMAVQKQINNAEPPRTLRGFDQLPSSSSNTSHDQQPSVLQQGELLEFLRSYHAVFYSCCAGLAGGQAVSFWKSSVELTKAATLGKRDEFENAGVYVCIVAAIGLTGMQLWFLNEGLRLFDALSIIPVYQASFTLCGILSGFIYFHEGNDTSRTTWQLLLFLMGSCLSLVGIFFLSKHGVSEHERNRPEETATAVSGGLRGDRAPVSPDEGTAVGGSWLSLRSIEHLSRFEEESLDDAMKNLRTELTDLRQANFALKSDLAWRMEVLERLCVDLLAAESPRQSDQRGGPLGPLSSEDDVPLIEEAQEIPADSVSGASIRSSSPSESTAATSGRLAASTSTGGCWSGSAQGKSNGNSQAGRSRLNSPD
jgi:hypothetical protein